MDRHSPSKQSFQTLDSKFQMLSHDHPRRGRLATRQIGQLFLTGLAIYLCWAVFGPSLKLTAADLTSVNVLVKDAESGQPMFQAHLTLQFREPGSAARLKRSRLISFSAKTNAQGRYRFVDIPKGTVRLIVTAERHQTFSKEFEVEKDGQLLEVSLKEPQPLL
jgi:hypothetical protein